MSDADSSAAPDEGPGDVPAGFTRWRVGGPYFQQLGPVYTRPVPAGGVVVALRLARQHMNFQGVAHGGMLATLADGALGINVALARKQRSGQVTVSLTMDFLSSARQGDWLEAHVTISRLGRQLAYASCDLRTEARHILRSSAVFAFVDRPLPPGPAAEPADERGAPPVSDG